MGGICFGQPHVMLPLLVSARSASSQDIILDPCVRCPLLRSSLHAKAGHLGHLFLPSWTRGDLKHHCCKRFVACNNLFLEPNGASKRP